jgi:hypothetical protein
MSNYAYIGADNIIKEVIIADASFINNFGEEAKQNLHLPDGQWYLLDDSSAAGIGHVYNPETETFLAPLIIGPDIIEPEL